MFKQNSDVWQLFNERLVASQDQVYGYILALLPNRGDADEVFQEASLKLLQNWEKYDPERPFAPWAFAIALNEVRLFARRNRHKGGMLSEAVLADVAEEQFRKNGSMDDSLNLLADCLKQLAAEKRDLLEQCYSGAQPIKAVAAMRRLSAEVLYKQLERIRRALWECMRTRFARG
jgi:RNA polymerase sigma-70 factor, ECF subfamily